MKSTPIALVNHAALYESSLIGCLKITCVDGTIVRGTNNDRDILVTGPGDSTPQTYAAKSGGTLSDVEVSSALDVTNAEFTGIFGLGPVTSSDIQVGKYDNATYSLFLVNKASPSIGVYRQEDGTVGDTTVQRTKFVFRLRGLLQVLQQSIGRVTTPTCWWRLGDSNCRKNLAPFTVLGTVSDVSTDGLTLFDPARTEVGPTGGIAITLITLANPCRLNLATPLAQANGTAVTLTGIVGPDRLNAVWQVQDKGSDGLSFAIGTDTRHDTAWVTGGTVVPLGSTSGWFDEGECIINGVSRKVKSYVPGQWTLTEPFPFALTGGEAYTLIAGCDKTVETCRVKYANILNFGGFPFIPGQDSVVRVGRSDQ